MRVPTEFDRRSCVSTDVNKVFVEPVCAIFDTSITGYLWRRHKKTNIPYHLPPAIVTPPLPSLGPARALPGDPSALVREEGMEREASWLGGASGGGRVVLIAILSKHVEQLLFKNNTKTRYIMRGIFYIPQKTKDVYQEI